MSFRGRLTLFFVAIVILPALAVGVVLFLLIADNESGKAKARVAAQQQTTVNLWREAVREAGEVAPEVGRDQRLADALRAGDTAVARARARELLSAVGASRIRIADGPRTLVDVGLPDAIGPAKRDLVDGRRRVAEPEIAVQRADAFARRAARITDADVVIANPDGALASTLRPPPRTPLPADGTIELGEARYRVRAYEAPDFGGEQLQVAVLERDERTASAILRNRLLALGLITGFFVLALTLAALVSRSLQNQIGSFLDAARRLGRGDFSAKVPTQGRDEFAELGGEFNRMAGQLERRLEELRRERGRLETTLRNTGDAFASNLDRDALEELAVRAAVGGVDADGGRVTVRDGDGRLVERAREGDLEGLERIVGEAESLVLASGEAREVSTAAGSALAHPLRGASGEAVLSAWRRSAPFGGEERELFHYLAAQAGVSLENVALHEAVQRQAVTDELTVHANHRAF